MALVLVCAAAGLVTEALAVLWVHYAEREQVRQLAAVALVQALCQVSGVVGIVAGWDAAAAYVAGYSLGPVLGIHVKCWLRRRAPNTATKAVA